MKRLVPDTAALSGATILATVAILAAGCGGGSDSSTESPKSSVVAMPTPERPVSAEVAAFEQAFDEKSCEQIQPLFFSTIRARPAGSPATKEECKGRSAETARLAGLTSMPVLGSREYGTAAMMEAPGTRGAEKDYTIWVLDSDGRFHFTQVQANDDPQFGSAFTIGDEAEDVARKLVRAVDQHDCEALVPLFSDVSRLVVERSRGEICQSVLDGKYFAPAVHATPNPALEVLGGTQDFAFVGVPTANAYFTITIGGSPGDLRVYDVLPSTPLEPAEA